MQLKNSLSHDLDSPLPGHQGWVRSVAFSPDGSTLASGGSDAIRIWDPRDGSEIHRPLIVPEPDAARSADQSAVPGASRTPLTAQAIEDAPLNGDQVTGMLLGGGYDADDAGNPRRRDSLGFNDDVNMLCAVLADERARPPLSVGLFGEWGSGKSFFMRLMRQRVDRLAEAAAAAERAGGQTRYCSHVVQITFNAWHYMDANLWASLAVEIFFRLASPASTALDQEKERVDKQHEEILMRLDTSQRLVAELARTRERAEEERRRIEHELTQAQDRRQAKADSLAKVVAEDVTAELDKDADVTEALNDVAAELGMSALASLELPGLVSDLRKLSGQVAATWRLLAKRRGAWAWALGFAAVFVASLLVGLVLLAAHGSQWHGWVSIGVALAAMASFVTTIRPVLAAVGAGLDQAEQALRRAEKKGQELRQRNTEQRVKLESELARLLAGEQSLAAQLAAATAAEVEAKSEEQDLHAGRRLRQFLEERSGSSDYRGQLGLISQLHQDFRRLNALLRLAEDNPADADDRLPRIDRIILYIDDLDRCPPARVVEVLQAIHLLLALPLFVVVVGVDPRWLLRSIKHHYRALLAGPSRAEDGDMSRWASTPQDYLEKIFQIPFNLMPMTSTGFAQLVDDLAGADAAPLQVSDVTPILASHQGDGLPPARVSTAAVSTAEVGPRQVQPPPDAVSGAVPATAEDVAPPPSAPVGPATATDVGELLATPDRPASAASDGTESELAEEQRIEVQAGSAASPKDDIDPNPAVLSLTGHEIRFTQALAPMASSPRALTRLVNIYRMIRSTQVTGGPSRFLDVSTGQGDYRVVLQLLAIISGFPELAGPAFASLLRAEPDMTWPAFVSALPPGGTRSSRAQR